MALALPAGVRHLGTIPFGKALTVERFRLDNGLDVLVCEDHSAPVVAYQTWFRVGSRHEKPGKTGLAHLFEHLMFNEVEGRPAGEFDRKMEEAGAESNASTWLDWTEYSVAVPKAQLPLVIELESERMSRLVLRDEQVTSEKEVVANERRYRVEDDVEGAMSEALWSTAFTEHAYRFPTIGWMADIESFTTEDCREFYRAYYAPNDALVVVAGDVAARKVVERIARAYGPISASERPVEDVRPEPPQTTERQISLVKPTQTDKVLIGYRAPAIGDHDHSALTLLTEVLFGGRASRVHRRLVRELEVASDVRASVGPFRDPGLFEIYLSARSGHDAEELVQALDAELGRVIAEPVSHSEIERARARIELSLLLELETAEGKASTIGFYETLLGRPAAAFDRVAQIERTDPSDLLRAARRYLRRESRTVVTARPGETTSGDGSEARIDA
jgi:zinc protease